MEHMYLPAGIRTEEAASTAITKEGAAHMQIWGESWTDVLSFLKIWNQEGKLPSNEARKTKHTSYVSPSVFLLSQHTPLTFSSKQSRKPRKELTDSIVNCYLLYDCKFCNIRVLP